MNAEQFYEEFKDALNYLGPGFKWKEQVIIQCKDGRIIMTFDGKEASFTVPSPT